MKLLDTLNPEQREAVIRTDGSVLVLAGAGSGKTRVLTHKVAYLLQEGIAKPWEVLAVTFTNKAAGDMKSRIERLLDSDLRNMWVGTFHSLFARIVRRFGDRIGYSSNFAIYDRQDQHKVMKEVLNDIPALAPFLNYKRAVGIISSMKSRLRPPMETGGQLGFKVDTAELYQAYERKMKGYNALDFDDLLMKPLELMQAHPDIANIYRNRFRYILVDEFQDTNITQNELLRIIYAKHKNITVVGDDDQAIYGWRGAELKNILNFPRTYPGGIIVRLERNYRSTNLILQVAQAVIENNLSRHGKTLWTDIESRFKPVLISSFDSREEAVAIASTIQDLTIDGVVRSSIAILYRTNAQSRVLENALREYNIPYTIVGGLKFYQRKEIKDLLAYLKLLVNPSDGVALTRIINFPPRGIGGKTIAGLMEYASDNNLELWEALKSIDESSELKPAAQKKLEKFAEMITALKQKAESGSFIDLVKAIIDKTGLIDHYTKEGDEESFARVDNLREFIAAVEEYVKTYTERTMDDFLQEVALVSETDEWEEGDVVSLMTLHSAKGLEFPVVFISGLEEGLFPLIREGEVDLEEERRLFYVGVTRAMERLFLSYASWRRVGLDGMPSRFIDEIPDEMLDDWTGFRRHYSESKPLDKYDRQPPPAQTSVQMFKRGDRVVHAKFGEGIVASIELRNNDEMVTVFFQGYGAKKLKLKLAGLKKLTV
ncbi:MAG: UvrD-helicase domain-containing protein [candidate division Zixibacteria bacterium]|nr:UvrD-helicase domain-containing protein [Candidatus Tariuqbacter arcticus]